MWCVSTSPGGRMCLFNMWPSSAWRGITGLEAAGLEEAVLHERALPWQPGAWVRSYWGVSAHYFFFVCVEGGSVIRLNSNWQFRSGTLLSHGFWCARSREPSCTKRLFYVSLQKAVGCFSTKDRSRRSPFTSVHNPFVFFKTHTQHTTWNLSVMVFNFC